jgi:hypothetical protein
MAYTITLTDGAVLAVDNYPKDVIFDGNLAKSCVFSNFNTGIYCIFGSISLLLII